MKEEVARRGEISMTFLIIVVVTVLVVALLLGLYPALTSKLGGAGSEVSSGAKDTLFGALG